MSWHCKELFECPRTLKRPRSGPLGKLLEGFCNWLLENGFSRWTIRTHLSNISHLNGHLFQGRYKAFVEQGMTETPEAPLKEVHAGSILGRKGFIKEALGRLRDGILEKQEISCRRQLRASHGSEEIIGFVLKHYKIPRGDLSRIKSQPRKLMIYLLKKYTGITNKQIGELFGELSYSAVAKVLERFSAEVEKDRLLRKQVERICDEMSNVKG